MAGNIADYAEAKMLEHSVGKTTWGAVTAYCALFTTTPGDAGTGGIEVSTTSTGYARVATAGLWGSAVVGAGTIANSSAITFPTATASWGTVAGVGIYDASTAGNLIWYGALTASKAIGTGDVFQFAVGNLSLAID